MTATMEQESISRELGPDIQLLCISALDENISWQLPAEVLVGIAGVILVVRETLILMAVGHVMIERAPPRMYF